MLSLRTVVFLVFPASARFLLKPGEKTSRENVDDRLDNDVKFQWIDGARKDVLSNRRRGRGDLEQHGLQGGNRRPFLQRKWLARSSLEREQGGVSGTTATGEEATSHSGSPAVSFYQKSTKPSATTIQECSIVFPRSTDDNKSRFDLLRGRHSDAEMRGKQEFCHKFHDIYIKWFKTVPGSEFLAVVEDFRMEDYLKKSGEENPDVIETAQEVQIFHSSSPRKKRANCPGSSPAHSQTDWKLVLIFVISSLLGGVVIGYGGVGLVTVFSGLFVHLFGVWGGVVVAKAALAWFGKALIQSLRPVVTKAWDLSVKQFGGERMQELQEGLETKEGVEKGESGLGRVECEQDPILKTWTKDHVSTWTGDVADVFLVSKNDVAEEIVPKKIVPEKKVNERGNASAFLQASDWLGSLAARVEEAGKVAGQFAGDLLVTMTGAQPDKVAVGAGPPVRKTFDVRDETSYGINQKLSLCEDVYFVVNELTMERYYIAKGGFSNNRFAAGLEDWRRLVFDVSEELERFNRAECSGLVDKARKVKEHFAGLESRAKFGAAELLNQDVNVETPDNLKEDDIEGDVKNAETNKEVLEQEEKFSAALRGRTPEFSVALKEFGQETFKSFKPTQKKGLGVFPCLATAAIMVSVSPPLIALLGPLFSPIILIAIAFFVNTMILRLFFLMGEKLKENNILQENPWGDPYAVQRTHARVTNTFMQQLTSAGGGDHVQQVAHHLGDTLVNNFHLV